MSFYLESPTTIDTLFFHKFDYHEVFDFCMDSISEECLHYDVETKRNNRNDMFLYSDNKWKKFVGTGKSSIFDWNHVDASINYKVNTDLGNRVRELDNKKVLKSVYLGLGGESKVHWGDMKNKIGSLSEVNSTINQDKFNSKFVKNFTNKLNLEIKSDSLTSDELYAIQSRGEARLSDDEWLNKGIDQFIL